MMNLRRQSSGEYLEHVIRMSLLPELALQEPEREQEDYRFRANEYIRDVLGYDLWRGTEEHPGQWEIVEAYELALKQQHEQLLFESGRIAQDELRYYRSGMIIKNRLHLSGGHGFGKTLLMALLCRHFYDNFLPSVAYVFAPTLNQLKNLFWKEVGTINKQAPLEHGRYLEEGALRDTSNHFVESKAVPAGNDTERIQGQHAAYQFYAADEAEGIGRAFWSAQEALMAGGVSIAFYSGNPKTRTSDFYAAASDPHCAVFVLNCIYHPNVLLDREVVPSAVRRQYVEDMLRKHCRIVEHHDVDKLTFEVPWRSGVIYLPSNEFQWRVMGIAPADATDRNFISVGRFQEACKRARQSNAPTFASIGVDMAWDGQDKGTVYVRHDGAIWLHAEMSQEQPSAYYFTIKDAARKLRDEGVVTLQVRIDAGGGFASGVIELLETDNELRGWFARFTVHRVYFGASGDAVQEADKYYDVITELTADVAETLLGVTILDPHATLQQDLCLREWSPRNVHGRFVRKLNNKGEFKHDHGRSPDHGDGFVLAAASEFFFKSDEWEMD